ncbi:hypothetical protein IPZ58_05300 [Streptomyces roseoverticillatus]|uniref:hypothetical protein n=1 Tax=Streptomyces roseoverticillatus TaxID=66429 RepID=UPI001F1D3269|nr:hypothetical protein [Streptomyces roseoverticillatus]MCF3100991.1 hypothetical protein [Streptomyces roseoverticillatus]
MILNGNANCGSCGMDLGYPPEDDEAAFCGHCQWDEHECPGDEFERIVLDVLTRIRDHEAEWLSTLREVVPSYDPVANEASDGETSRMDEVQTDQAFAAQQLLRELMKEFEVATT